MCLFSADTYERLIGRLVKCLQGAARKPGMIVIIARKKISSRAMSASTPVALCGLLAPPSSLPLAYHCLPDPSLGWLSDFRGFAVFVSSGSLLAGDKYNISVKNDPHKGALTFC